VAFSYGVLYSGASRSCPLVAFSYYGVPYSGASRSCPPVAFSHGILCTWIMKLDLMRRAQKASHAQTAHVFYYQFFSTC
jgi:hypothetical protein